MEYQLTKLTIVILRALAKAWLDHSLLVAACDRHTNVVRALVFAGADVNLQQQNDGSSPGSSPLSVASQEGHLDCVKLLVHHGAEVDIRRNNGATPLYWAAKNGHIKVVQFLIEQHADVNACCSNGESCLWTAAFDGNTDVVHALVYAEADVDLKRNDGSSPLIVASEKGHTDCVKLLVHHDAQIDTRQNNDATPLFYAARNGHIEVVQFLIEQHADVNACCCDGSSCLWTAAFHGHTDVVHALVSAGADVNLQRKDGASPLIVASEKGHVDIVVMLLDGRADIEMRDNYGGTAVYQAASFGQIDVLDALIARGADVDAVNYDVRSPLCAAAINGHMDVVKRLIQHKANIIGEEGGCNDPLSWVAAWGKQEVKKELLQLLMNNGALVGPGINSDDDTAPMCAVFHGDTETVKMIVKCGADIHPRNVDNLQAIDIASYSGRVDVVKFLSDRHTYVNYSCLSSGACNTAVHLTTDVLLMRSLLENGAEVEAENVDGLRPIHCAVRTGLVELVELLILHGANVDAADVFGNSPLHEAVCQGLNVEQLLVRHGAKVNVQNIDGKTPLHIAIERQHSEVVMFLLNVGAVVGLTDVWRNTPLHYLTDGQLQCDEHEVYVVKQTKKYQHLLVHNAVGVTALSSVATHDIQDYVHHRQTEISHASSVASQADLSSPQQLRHFSSWMIPCLRELQHIMALPKTIMYYRKELACTDCYGNTPLHYAVGVYQHLKMYRISNDVVKTVEFLVKRGADINAQNNDGLTPLHMACGKEAIQACLQHADDWSFTITDKRGRNFWHLLFLLQNQNETELAANIQPIISASDAKYNSDDLSRMPLHYACMKESSWIGKWFAKEFIQEFSDEHINKQDRFGRTALHYAAMADNTVLMDTLKAKKAVDATVQDNFEKTANDYKVISQYYKVTFLLPCN